MEADTIKLMAGPDRPVTDFPGLGDTRRVSLRTSNFRVFDLRFALDLRKNYPDLWQLGAALAAPDQFDLLIPVQRRGGSVRTEAEAQAVRDREVWAQKEITGPELDRGVAQIRWLVIGALGIDTMKALVNAAKADLAAGQNAAAPADHGLPARAARHLG